MMSKLPINKMRGTTLIEFMLYAAISSGLLLGIGFVSLDMFETKNKGGAIAEVRYATATALRTISKEVKGAKRVIAPPSGAASSTLTYETANSEMAVIRQNGERLEHVVGTSAPVFLTPEGVVVSSADFQNLTPQSLGAAHIVKVTLTLSVGFFGANQSYRFSETYTTSASMRATP